MNKSEIRKLVRARRKATSQETIHKASVAISEEFINSISLEQISSIHVFLPIIKNKELDTRILMKKIAEKREDIQFVVPVTDFSNLSMRSVLLAKDTPLVENKIGIPEPVGGSEYDTMKLDMVVLPLMAFDNRGYRVGYGKGFYDRFLANCRKDIKKIGLCIDPPLTEHIIDVDQYDQPMQACVTPGRTYYFTYVK